MLETASAKPTRNSRQNRKFLRNQNTDKEQETARSDAAGPLYRRETAAHDPARKLVRDPPTRQLSMMTKPSALIHTFVALLMAAFVSHALAGQPRRGDSDAGPDSGTGTDHDPTVGGTAGCSASGQRLGSLRR